MEFDVDTIRATARRLKADGINISESALRRWVKQGILRAVYDVHTVCQGLGVAEYRNANLTNRTYRCTRAVASARHPPHKLKNH